MSENIAVIGVSLGGLISRGTLLQREIDQLFQLYADGKIKPLVGKTFPLAQAAAAHQYIHERKNIGKVLLTMK
jgi:NADPH2:quinone reductase